PLLLRSASAEPTPASCASSRRVQPRFSSTGAASIAPLRVALADRDLRQRPNRCMLPTLRRLSRFAATSVVMVVLSGGGRILRAALCVSQAIHKQLHIGDQVGRVALGKSHVGHAHAWIFGGKREGGGVLLGPHLFRVPDIIRNPGAPVAAR